MAVSHNLEISATRSFEAFQGFVDARFSEDPERSGSTQAEFESGLLRHVYAMAREVLQKDIERHDVDTAGLVVDGAAYRRKHKAFGDYITTAGLVRVERTIYVERGGRGGASVCPLERRLGIVDGSWTLKAAEMGSRYMEEMTSAKSSELLKLHGGMSPSTSHLDRLVKAVGATWEADRPRHEVELRGLDELPAATEVVAIMVSLDGIMVPMKDAPRSSSAEGPKGHKEASSGTLCLLDAQGQRLKTIKLGQMPEPNKATLQARMVAEMKWLKDMYPGVIWHAISDGAKTNWKMFSQMALDVGVKLSRTLDFWHAMEHLADVFALVWGQGSEKARDDLAHWRKELLTNCHGPGKLLRYLKTLESRIASKKRLEAFTKEFKYFKANHEDGRMRWATLRKQNLPIGSGVQEAACKTLVTQRMKCSGMSWRHRGGQAILDLRAFQQSGRMEGAWKILGNTFRQPFEIDANPCRKRPARQEAA